jgi:ribose transport system permease protein
MNSRLTSPRVLRSLLPAFSLIAILLAIFYLQPRAMSYFGLNLLLNLALPIAFATLAQMCVIAVNDLDLGIGAFVGFVACVGATWLNDQPLFGLLVLAVCIGAYGALGALIHLRNLPSIVVTLGMSFVWLGLALLVLPTPGGKAPGMVTAVMKFKPPVMPMTIYASIAVALIVHVVLKRSAYGVVLRGVGGNPQSVERAGWSLIRAKVTMYAMAGFFGVLSGISLIGLTSAADANIALRYTLLSIAGVILGGGEFVGGRISPIGAVLGAITLTLTGSFLSFLRISPDWQIGAQGAVLIVVLALRALINRKEMRKLS